jgi:hypothetical protein
MPDRFARPDQPAGRFFDNATAERNHGHLDQVRWLLAVALYVYDRVVQSRPVSHRAVPYIRERRSVSV